MAAPKPPGWPSVVPRIFADDAAGLVAFVRKVFGAQGELIGEAHAEMRIGDAVVMVSGTEFRAAMPACLYVYVDSADAVHERALDAGATCVEEPRDLPYGDRRAMFEDDWGNVWQVAEYRR